MSADSLDTNTLRGESYAVSAVDHEAEIRLLAAVFADASLLDDLADVIMPADFGSYKHEIVFTAMQACDTSGRPVDVVTVADEMSRAKTLDSVNGIEGLRWIAAAGAETPEDGQEFVSIATAEFAAYADIVRQRATRRRLLAAARTISGNVLADAGDSEYLIEAAEKAVFSVSRDQNTSSAQLMPQIVAEVHERMANAKNHKLLGHSWGIGKIDEVTAGLQGGQMVVVAGRPGSGKSSLLCQVANRVAQTSGKLSVILSYEMQATDIVMRLLSAATGVKLGDLMLGKIPDGMDQVVAREAEKLASTNLLIDDNPPNTITGVKSYMRRLARRSELGLVSLDYLQLMGGSGNRPGANRENEVSEISRGIKTMAMELKIPFVAASQLNRGLESRPGDKRPQLSDLRESGSIEQDANCVVMCHRPYMYDQQQPENEAELIVAKNRNGAAPVTAYVDWEGQFTRFRDSNRTGPTEVMGANLGAAPRPGMHQPASPGGYTGVSGFGL
jgi:replicative DNA helicase